MTAAPNVVLDTMILAQAAASPRGPAAEFLKSAEAGVFTAITSWHQLLEFDRTMHKPWFRRQGISDEYVEQFAEAYAGLARVAPDRSTDHPLTADPGDNFIVRLAQTTGAMIVTRDHGILKNHPVNLPVVTPGQFARTVSLWTGRPPSYRLGRSRESGSLAIGF